MFTISKLAAHCGLSRTALLYYERIGLLHPAARSGANYRAYGPADLARLEQICVYRSAGLKLSDIRVLVEKRGGDAPAVLERRLAELSAEIERLRGQQRSILKLLKKTETLRRMKVVTKDKLVSVMRAAGLTEEDMHRFHGEFERSAPQEHQEFLEFLHIPEAEIRDIRDKSRKG